MFKRKGSLVTDGIGVLVAVVVLAGVAIPVATDAMVTDLNSVTNETFNATTDPFTYTVAEASNSNFDEFEPGELTCYSDAGSTALNDVACNVTNAGAGEITVSTTVDSGAEAVDYKWQPDGYITNPVARTVVNFVPLGLALGIFMGAIALVA